MRSKDFLISTDSSRAIVMEPTIKSTSYLKFLKKSAIILLKSNNYKPKSIKTDGFYIIIFLYDNSQLVQAVELLKKISGVSYIFIGAAMKLKYDTLSGSVLSIANKLIIEGEKYFIKIEKSKLARSKDDEFTYFKHDLEFFIKTELSSKAKGLVPVEDSSHADKILYILIGNNIAIVSLLVLKGSDRTPFNFLQDVVVCPVYDDCSLLSLAQVLDSGYMPLSIFFYRSRLDLIKKLRKFDEIIVNYPVEDVIFYLFSIYDIHGLSVRPAYRPSKKEDNVFNQKNSPIQRLIYEQVIIRILLHTDFPSKFVSFPFIPYIHPHWFIRKNIELFHQSKKIVLTPLLFSLSPRAFEKKLTTIIGKSSSVDESIPIQYTLVDSEPQDFAKAEKKYKDLISPFDFKKFSLNMRKNDIFDILDSI